MNEFLASLTDDDVAFVKLAVQHYAIFAEQAEKQGEDPMAGLMRAQEFHAEQLLGRLEACQRFAGVGRE